MADSRLVSIVKNLLVVQGSTRILCDGETSYWVTASYGRRKTAARALGEFSSNAAVLAVLIVESLWHDSEGLDNVIRKVLRDAATEVVIPLFLAETMTADEWDRERSVCAFFYDVPHAGIHRIDSEIHQIALALADAYCEDPSEEIRSEALEFRTTYPQAAPVPLPNERMRSARSVAEVLYGQEDRARLAACEELLRTNLSLGVVMFALVYIGPSTVTLTGGDALEVLESIPTPPVDVTKLKNLRVTKRVVPKRNPIAGERLATIHPVTKQWFDAQPEQMQFASIDDPEFTTAVERFIQRYPLLESL